MSDLRHCLVTTGSMASFKARSEHAISGIVIYMTAPTKQEEYCMIPGDLLFFAHRTGCWWLGRLSSRLPGRL